MLQKLITQKTSGGLDQNQNRFKMQEVSYKQETEEKVTSFPATEGFSSGS